MAPEEARELSLRLSELSYAHGVQFSRTDSSYTPSATVRVYSNGTYGIGNWSVPELLKLEEEVAPKYTAVYAGHGLLDEPGSVFITVRKESR